MQYSNMTHEELVNHAFSTNDQLAITLINQFESRAAERDEELSEVLDDVAQGFADKIEEHIKSFVDGYYLNPESDYNRDTVENLTYSIDVSDVKRLIDELTEDHENAECYGYASPITDDCYTSLKDIDDDAIRDLALAFYISSVDALDIEIDDNPYKQVPYTLASQALFEQQEDLEYYLEDIPESLHESICEKLTGHKQGTVYHIDLTYSTLNVTANLEWLEDWVKERRQS